MAGEARQETEFHVPLNSRALGRWLLDHGDELTEAAGAKVLATRRDLVHLHRDDENGIFDFVARRKAEGNIYREEMVKDVGGNLTAEEFSIEITPDSTGCQVKISASASVPALPNIKIAVGLRRSIRGIKALIEQPFAR